LYHLILESPLSKKRDIPHMEDVLSFDRREGSRCHSLIISVSPVCGEMLSKESDDGQRQNLLEYQDLII